MQGLGDLRRNIGFKLLLRHGGEVAHRAQRAGLVLQLHHDDGVLGAVDLAEVGHQVREGRGVGVVVGR